MAIDNIIVLPRRPADGLLKELRRDLEACYSLAEEHLTAAQNAVNASDVKFFDACGDAIGDHNVPFHKRMQRLTELLAEAEGIEIERKDHA